MFIRTRLIHASVLSLLAIMFATNAVSAKPWDILPSWPISNVGDAIPDELISYWAGGKSDSTRIGERCSGMPGQYRSFPAKARVNQQLDHPEDPNKNCGDGDQTAYNGYLCAVGFLDACRAVAEAQDQTGRFFRSPHRTWVWNNLCFKENIDGLCQVIL
ncbi:hypothetical protein EDD52_1673 [Primorskyibacter sedentarius]|uniref:Phospholipase A2-like protein n=1 Tax=Primorskyibacter sedentarius TaxID=745311 RepID=A0A4R3IID9_9RHOB|nr:hypothetical protein [Primorskyibacter sedentarius]TCS46624.1 hypothetical protein EDD52_1673 [Primorskyibacter sedentarius]